MTNDDVIYGKNKDTNIVNISIKDNTVFIFKEFNDGVYVEEQPYKHWVLAPKKYNDSFSELKGNQHFKWYKEYNTTTEYYDAKKNFYKLGCYTAHNFQENFMLRHGYTYFKGLQTKDVSVLSFDIETTGLNSQAKDAEVLLVTNTYRKGDYTETKTFCVTDYKSDKQMLLAWSNWVVDKDPSVLLGHNIVMFDIPYILSRCPNLPIGRFNEPMILDNFDREFRKDGSQSYTYKRVNCFGREVIDTFFVSIKADIARKYETYRLKNIIAQEGLEEQDRQHYDASTIKTNWQNPEERKKIIAYAEADSRDPIKLYDLMIATFFYMCPVVPKTFQLMTETAAGSQLNSVMVRAYLQHNGAIAKADELPPLRGAISFGVPGIYRNLIKIDFSALYPSIMRQYKLCNEQKDPNRYFPFIVEYFANYRQEYKQKYKETGLKLYDDMQQVAKTVANSCYGFLSANGLNYNSPKDAAFITAKARELLDFSIKWATSKETQYWMTLFEEKTK